MSNLFVSVGTVIEIENTNSNYNEDGNHDKDQPYDGLRVRVRLDGESSGSKSKGGKNYLPWAFPLLPKTFQSIPKEGEGVIVFHDGSKNGQRYYIGPIISQPQFNTYSSKKNGTSLLLSNDTKPLERMSKYSETNGSFPKSSDVAIVGRGGEDVILRHDNNKQSSEIQLRAGVRKEPTNSQDVNLRGNIIFNGIDPAYIQLKYKKGLSARESTEANSLINVVANRINIISNKDNNVSDYLQDKNSMISDENIPKIMENLHQVPKGDNLIKLLEILKGCILYHVHPWAGMPQCGDWKNYINELEKFNMNSILSQYVRIS